MRINLKKVSAIAASALLMGLSVGTAAAANYPQPFVVGGNADVAIVYGSSASVLDAVQAGNIQANLQSYMTGTSSDSTTISGEAVELYTGGTKIYISDGLNKIKSVITESDLPSVLDESSFSGNVDATITQTIQVGAYPNITYEKQPTSSDDPNLALKLSTSTDNQAYNLTLTFSKAINFSHADSEGEDINIFGQEYTISASTSNTNLVLLKSAEKLSLSSDAPTADVTISGKAYTIELVSASDTSATIKVTDETGASESKEINEAQSKKINGITVAITTADETNLKLSASVVAGSEKITLTDSSEVKVGEDDTAIEGTKVYMTGTTANNADQLTKLVIAVTVDDSDKDALKVGESLIDPVFGTVKLGFSGLNIAEDSTTAREDISVSASGDDKLQLTMTDMNGNTKTVNYANYEVGGANNSLEIDDDHKNITIREMEKFHEGDYVMVGNEDEGHLLRLSNANNASTGYSDDKVTFVDIFTGATIDTTWTNNGVGTTVIGGKSYDVALEGDSGISDVLYNVTLNYPDSASGYRILFPTIQTSKGAKVAFYEPVQINVTDAGMTSGFMVPNGADSYQTIGLTRVNATNFTVTCVSTNTNVASGIIDSVNCGITNTGFTYNISYVSADTLSIQLSNVAGTTAIANPAVMIFEEKDDNNQYEGMIILTEDGASSDDGIGISDVERTWTNDGVWDAVSLASDSKKTKEIDLYGSIVSVDGSDSDQNDVTISYPDEQVYALLYIGEVASSISGGTTSGATQLGDVIVKDSEVSSVSSKNLVVVGGSCINSVAAKLVGSAACGSSFTDATGIGSGQFLIESFGDAYTSGKIALLVAGYEAADTVNAANFLKTQTVDTTAGKKYKGTSATSAELVTETA